MTDDDTTLRETMQQLRIDVATLHSAVTRLESAVVTITQSQVSKDRFDSLDDRVDDLESWRDWAFRIVLGAVILALVGLVLVQNGKP